MEQHRMPKDPAKVLLPHIEALLGPGAQLRGWCIASEQSTFSGNPVVVGVTDQRLLLQTTTGEKRKVMMMRGTGLFGKLGGGETQQAGIAALAEWLRTADPTYVIEAHSRACGQARPY